MRFFSIVSACLLTFVAAVDLNAGVINGGFETGNFTGWTTIGTTSVTGITTLSNIPINPTGTASITTTPTEGVFQSLLTTGTGVSASSLNSFFGITLPANQNGIATEGSGIKQVVSLSAGQTLSFDWRFVSSESFNSGFDYSFLSVNGAITTLGTFNSVPYPTNYNTFVYTAATTGTYTFGVGVVDTGDTVVDSRLFVDNFRTSSVATVPEPTSMAVFALGLGLFAIRKRTQKRA